MLVKLALKGVMNSKLSIAICYEPQSELLCIKMVDPVGHIYSKFRYDEDLKD